jgi:uncharacterized repeat protein (TIGR03803 family)
LKDWLPGTVHILGSIIEHSKEFDLNMTKARELFLHVSAAGLGLILAAQAQAQTLMTLYDFTNGGDGAMPLGDLLLAGNTLYGTAEQGGTSGYGTVFALNTDGTGFTTLYSFTDGSDGAKPRADLILSGNTMYGTAEGGGSAHQGTVFAVNTDGTGFTPLYSLTGGSDGSEPWAGLVLSSNTLYGTAWQGGSWGDGTVFAVNTDGTGFTNLHSFTAASTAETGGTNSDGATPVGQLVLSGSTLYGTAWGGGTSGDGTVFGVNTDGTDFTTLHSFTETSDGSNGGTNSDGAWPRASLVLSGNTLYGTAPSGGSGGVGTVFAIKTDGTGFTTLYSFTDGTDGGYPYGGLVLSGSTLYGTAEEGGSAGYGTVFAVKTDGTGFTTLYSFTDGSDGATPIAGLILSGNTLYGTASGGGSGGYGTVFSISLPAPSAPQLTITLSGTNVVLTWPASPIELTLQSTTNLLPAAWSTVSPAPVLVNGQNTVANPISGTQQYYQLSR